MKNNCNGFLGTNNLKKIAFFRTIVGLCAIPVNFFCARQLSNGISYAIEGNPIKVIKIGSIILLLLFGFKFFETISGYYLSIIQSRLIHKCKLNLYNSFLSSPLYSLYKYDVGSVKECLQDDFQATTQIITTIIPKTIVGGISFVLYFIYIARVSLIVAVVLGGIGLLQIFPPIIVKRFLAKNYKDTRDIESKITNQIMEAQNGLSVIKMFDLEKWYISRLKKKHNEYFRIGTYGILSSTTERSLDQFISFIVNFGTYAIIGLFVLNGILELSYGIIIIAISSAFFSSFTILFSSIVSFAVVKEARKRLLELCCNLNYSRETVFNSSEVSLREIAVKYNTNTVFNNFSANFPSDGLYIIQGKNGSGKTTLLNLIVGLQKPDRGEIKIGGITPSEFSESIFINDLFYLPQEDALFDFTPNELFNTMYSLDINQAIINAFELGLQEEQIHSVSIKCLSGGERKKVFLSIALSSKAKILLLDEPTNGLDNHSKELFVQEIKKRNGLIIIVSHDTIFNKEEFNCCTLEGDKLNFGT